MTLDPQLTMIRSREVGADFYDSVMQRINAKADQPSGVMFHFSGSYRDQFFVVSGYRDRDGATEMFSEFTGPEVAEEISATGSNADIARNEYEITRFAIHGDEELQGFRFTEPGEFVAVLITNPSITRDRYLGTTAKIRFPEAWPDGMIIHVAGMFGSHMGVFDVWRADADLRNFYGAQLAPAFAELHPEVSESVEVNPSAITVHSLYINRSTFEDAREYLREE